MLVDETAHERIQDAPRESEERLAAELAATRRLQDISTLLIQESDVDALYGKILDAAVDVMHADMASMQVLDEAEDGLRLLAWRGFGRDFGDVFGLVGPDRRTSCSVARHHHQRIVVPDVEKWVVVAGTPELDDLRKAGVRAVQSTPLISRSGNLLGMMTTHWRAPHRPLKRDLRLLDVLARQAADLLERGKAFTALQESESRLMLLLGEMSHRVRNLFAVTSGLVTLSARSAQTPKELAEAIRGRLAALMRAQELSRPGLTSGAGEAGQETTLHALTGTIFAPYVVDRCRGREGIVLTGADLPLGPNATANVALVLHELATNAAKYGALSKPGGVIHLDCSVADGTLALAWKELGGPPLRGAPETEGFGGTLARALINDQFGGQLSREWAADGLIVHVAIPIDRLGD